MTAYYRGLSAETQLLGVTLVGSGGFKSMQQSFFCVAVQKINGKANESLV